MDERNKIASGGEVYIPREDFVWNPKGVPAYKKPIVQVVCSFPTACMLFGWFLSVRGYQSVLTSRLILYSAAAVVMFIAYTLASSFRVMRRLFQIAFTVIILAVAIAVDINTVPKTKAVPSGADGNKPQQSASTDRPIDTGTLPPSPSATVSPSDERKQKEIAMGFVQQWTIDHPSGPAWYSPEGTSWVNKQLQKKHYLFVMTPEKQYAPHAGIHIEGVPADIHGVVTVNTPIGVIANGAHSTVTGNTQVNFGTPTATADQPTYQQQCAGSACAQGPGSQATYNQLGAPRLLMTDQQRDGIRDAMKPYAGIKVKVLCIISEDSLPYGRQLFTALQQAGMKVDPFVPSMMLANRGNPYPSGISLDLGNNRMEAATALVLAMRSTGLLEPNAGLRTTMDTQDADTFTIIVTPNR